MTDSVAYAHVPARRDVLLVALAAAWTLFVWGSRIRLIGEAETGDWTNWARILVSVAFGVVLAAIALRMHAGARNQWAAHVMITFAVWTVIVWVSSLVSVLAGDHAAAFKVVHGVLATVSLTMGTLVASVARRESLFYPRDTSTQAAASTTTR